MSIRESFHWVALPAGVAPATGGGDGRVCRVSVFVAPQVTLADEPARGLRLDELTELVDWPAALDRVELAIEVEGRPPVAATRVGPPASSALWRRLFPGTTRVEPFVPDDPTVHTVMQYGTADVLDMVETGYSTAAMLEPPAPDHFDPEYWAPEQWLPEPEVGEVEPGVIDEVGPVDPIEDDWSMRNLFPEVVEVVALPDRPEVAPELARFAESLRLHWDPVEPPVEPPVGAFDAVEIAEVTEPTAAERRAALVDSYDLHRILAALGDHPALLRALGLVIDVEVPADPPDQGLIRAVIRRPDGGAGGSERIDLTPWVTVTAAAPNGFAATSATDDLAPPGLEALDRYRIVQLDLEGVGIQLLGRAAEEAAGAGNGGGRELPPLRTVGLRLVESGAADRLLGRAAHVNELRAAVAEDADDGTLDADDVQRGFRVDVRDETTGHWYPLHARQARYSGTDGPLLGPVVDEGSVSGSFTGRPLAPGENLGPDEPIAVDESLVTWDGWSLAASRPGRVVSADPRAEPTVRPVNDPLTSTGLRIDTAALPGSLPRLRFGREYRMRLRAVDLAGNALTVTQADRTAAGAAVTEPVTFRRFERVPPPVPGLMPEPAGPGESERRLVVRSGLDDGDDTFGPTPGVDERLLFAPECSVALAEWHGAFDDGVGADAPAAARAATYRHAARESGTLQPGATELPWLADPASAGACFSGLPGMAADDVLTVAWPRSPVGPGPIRLRLVALLDDQLRPPEVDEPAGLVTAFLPPGGRVTAAVSSVLADERMMALPAVWRERLDAESLAVVEDGLARHRHAMVTPSLPIELVHATQRPRLAPQPAGPTEFEPRVPGQTDLRVIAPWTVHAPSTGTVELEASWTVPRDEPVQAEDGRWVAAADTVTTPMGRPLVVPPVPVEGPVTARVTVGDTPAGDPLGATIALDTTAHLELRLRAVATSRFAEFFPPEYGPAAAGDTPARASRLTAVSEPLVIDVPNTRRPPAPTVLEVMPLVVRHREAGMVRREGGWLRIWLARPWYVTGWDEFPAVLAAVDGQPLRPERGDGYQVATLVGPDPARAVPAFAGITPHALGGFPAAWAEVRLVEMQRPDGAGGRAIALSDRAIDWDPRRGAWFVDLRVDVPDLYFPFVRLAIARDQPHSIRGEAAADEYRVSPVVTLDPIQVLPDRELRHAVTGNGIRLDLTGRSYDVSLMPVDQGSPERPDWVMGPVPGGAPSAARVIAQRRVRTGGDELLAWADVFEQHMGQAAEAPAGTLVAGTTLPFDPTEPPGEFRLLVLEEDFAYGARGLMEGEGMRARVTFAEVIPLPRAVAPAAG